MKDNFRDILKRYNEGRATEAEKAQIEAWYLSLGQDRQPPTPEEIQTQFETGKQEIQKRYPRRNTTPLWRSIAAAAAVLLILGVYFGISRWSTTGEAIAQQDSIMAGQQIAVLRTHDGQEIDLQQLHTDSILASNGLEIRKLTEGRIQVSARGDLAGLRTENIIRTPKGGEFEVVMPDHSLIKLNAASEVQFYSDYNATNREVHLVGEAFFDIQPSGTPFVVHTTHQKVTVLGTQFNIKAYSEEAQTTTTLLRGSVKVNDNHSNAEIMMKPGDRLVHNGTQMQLQSQEQQKVDWVNDEIVFNQKTMEQIMNDIARWYNVEVHFENADIKNRTFTGTISRYEDFNKVLDVLEKTESMTFEVQGRKIIIR